MSSEDHHPVALHTRLLRLLLSHGGMFILVSFVAAFGAWTFILLEQPYEDETFLVKSLKIKDLEDSENYFISFCWHLGGQNISDKKWNRTVREQLKLLQAFTLDLAHNHGYDGTKGDWSYSWNFPNALLFTVTIMTTIGYGHISPKTNGGQLFTILFAMIGTPLLLVFLANIGDGMARVFTFTYSRLCCRWCRTTRYKEERKPGKRAKRVSEDEVGKEEYMPTDEVNVPITINLMIIAMYLGMGALIFSEWEQWDMMASYYFSFVTLSTIGFGDMVPGNSFLDRTAKTSFTKAFKMGTTIGYCMIGMALISMCIQMMQEQIVAKVRWTGQELGLIHDSSHPRLRLRRTRRGAAPETTHRESSYGVSSAREQRRLRQEETVKRRLYQQQQQEQQQRAEESEQRRQAARRSDSEEDLFNLA
ncbi:TWiK family of potassium channels protein 7-like [Amphibalanus amphitrite]|uniref:TWiK family of potassium channels protein 7-like n=1 Tax=Amphibalanus amphitrite TaxID=1232801 RepID=UPI001C91416F|nr:TWiK family of potassium channels protein 7-like [Amphibalanus amphitrite]